MGCIGSPATATTRPPRNGPIHRQVRPPSKSDRAVVGVAMACAPSSPAYCTSSLWSAQHPSMLTRECQRAGEDRKGARTPVKYCPFPPRHASPPPLPSPIEGEGVWLVPALREVT